MNHRLFNLKGTIKRISYPFTFLIFFFLLTKLDAQDKEVDSLRNLITEHKQDSVVVNAHLQLSVLVSKTDIEDSKQNALKAIELSKKINFKKGEAYGYKNLGLLLYAKGELTKELIDNWKKSLELFEEIGFKKGISNLQSNIGSVYQSKGDDPTALDYFLKSVRLAEEIKDSLRISTAYLNIGSVYSNEKATYDEALEAYSRSKKIFEKIHYKDGVAYAAINMAELYLNKNDPKAALQALDESMVLFDQNDPELANSHIMVGKAYEQMGMLNVAEKNYLKAIAFAKTNDAKMEASKAYIHLADIYNTLGKPDKALDEYKNALLLTQSTKVFKDKKDIYEGLAKVYAKLNDYQNAFNYQKQFSAIGDSIRNDDYEKTLGNLRFQFDIENKEKEIELLNVENKVKEVDLERAAISKKYFLAVSTLLFAIAMGILFQYFYIKKSNKNLALERNRAEQILLNILPKETAEELKKNGKVRAKEFKQITVLFTDFKGFSVVAEKIPAEALVRSVDFYFRKFDEIIQKNGLEKIKTIGDAYMCAGGLPTENETNAVDAFNAAQEILSFVEDTLAHPPEGIHPFEIRIGLNTGGVVAGVVGTKKFQYDIWGSTVNVAARMESSSLPGKINVSENTYNLLKDKIDFTYRGIITVKNSQKLKMYFVGKEPSENIIIS